MSSSTSDIPQPKIFIGSAKEAIPIAKLVQKELFYGADAIAWTDAGIFRIGESTIKNLVDMLNEIPYAIFVMNPVDTSIVRKLKYGTPRDNLLFELGLWAGRYGMDSVFMIVPFGEKVRLPSDLDGILVGEYKKREGSGKLPQFNVSVACQDIIEAINKMQEKRLSEAQAPAHEKFWADLAERIVILYGVDYSGDIKPQKHHRVSLRDLDTMTDILRFLARWYPEKRVIPLRYETSVLPDILQADADLILIGGPVRNKMFAKYHAHYKGQYRLAMGSLSRVDGKLKFQVLFGNTPPDKIAPSPDDPKAVEAFPSEHVSRDYGLVTSGTSDVYGKRRVITIAGIKGHGTRGAGMALTGITGLHPGLDKIIPSTLTENDLLEMVIASNVSDDRIYGTELVGLTFNGKHKKLPTK